ncbi:MAG: efflux RND transporter periplasmic adaptor subunit [Deltaproteobacteria bacterium]|nr:efflux RND transporter periplasmic adaptor subunit [Deltaproteobacteria bacterium]
MPRRLLVLAALVFTAACRQASATLPETRTQKAPAVAAPQALSVETAPVERRQMPRFLTLTGSVLADKQSEVAANVSGRITATFVERGQQVKAGQPVAIVDSKAAGFSAQAAAAQLSAAQTQVALAEQDCQRADTLFEKGSIPQAEHARMKAQCQSQLFQAKAARANANLATKLAGDTIIRAPIDGAVGERFVSVGEYVQPPTRVATVYAVDPVRVSISVPEGAVSQVREGQVLEVEVAAWPDRRFPATVRYVSPALRPMTRDLVVEAVAGNGEGALRPGMFATVKLLTGEEVQPTVPLTAIRTEGAVKRLFLARNGLAYEMVVRTGLARDGRIAVLEPLGSQDRVIVRPPPGLTDGVAIQ